MKKTLLIAGALLALTASMSFAAGGVNLSWTDCGTSGLASKSSACLNNAAAGTLFCSAIPPIDLASANGQTSTIDIQTSAAALSPWWHMETPAGCTGRTTAFTCDMNFLSNTNCSDPWAGGASPGSNYAAGFNNIPNRARGKGTGAISGTTDISPAGEWYICKLNISGAKTAGTGNCVGCLDGACIVLNDVFLTQPLGAPGGNVHIGNPINSQSVTWQASGASVQGGCPGATPNKNATWGSVKSLYR